MSESRLNETSFDVVVIGGGPAGYVAAIRASQLGFRTACVERGPTLGGTCLNVGCIPSKALLDSSELYEQVERRASGHGVQVEGVRLDLAAMMRRKEGVVAGLTGGIKSLFHKYGVEWIRGAASFRGVDHIAVERGEAGASSRGESLSISANHFVIATGSQPGRMPGVEFDEDRVLTSTGALSLSAVPNHLLVIGGGVIGLELGSVWLRLGAQVTVLEALPSILPGSDLEIANVAAASFRKQGFAIRTSVRVAGVEKSETGVRVSLEGGENLEADRVLIAIGRRPFSEGLGLESIGVHTDSRGAVLVDERYHTGVGAVYAVGDVIGGAMLAHKAMEEGTAVAEILAGKPARVEYDSVANVVYTMPEIAWVGKGESQLRAEGRELCTGTFPYIANGRARAMGETED